MDPKLTNVIRKSLFRDVNIFQQILDQFETYYNSSSNNILELKKKSNKSKGDLFENFCVHYLKNTGYSNAWLIKDTPELILNKLKLKSFDMGIDIVATKDDKFYAIQAKYRKVSTNKKYNVLGWKSLSTFFAYCSRTGPWEKYIVMTSCDYIRRMGTKSDKDITMAKKHFLNTNKEIWKKMINYEDKNNGKILNPAITTQLLENTIILKEDTLTRDQIREKRAAYFENILDK